MLKKKKGNKEKVYATYSSWKTDNVSNYPIKPSHKGPKAFCSIFAVCLKAFAVIGYT